MVKVISFLTISFLLLTCAVSNKTAAENKASESSDIALRTDSILPLIPYPTYVKKNEGTFELNSKTQIVFPENLSNEGNYFIQLLKNNCNFQPRPNAPVANQSGVIYLGTASGGNNTEQSQNQGYQLQISDSTIIITGTDNASVMHGIQTLRQLFVAEFHSEEKRDRWYLPTLEIRDKAKFKHRGLLLDVCRHFFEKDVVLKYIDALAYYKMNVLHLHLTEDQGWRMPIEKYPLLNEISSWRTEADGSKYGGFYTKEELKEIVAYAKERHITVIPEIELPGHAQAALAAYPQFSCNGGPIEVANDWGVFKEIYCAGNDSTFIFIEDILTEVMEIFPSQYIHIGGDEAPKFRWEHCDKCQNRMQTNDLADEHELQAYFINRIERFLAENGRKLIGWDEILEGDISKNAVVQFWRGMDGVAETAKKQPVIVSPTSHCYLDYGLSSIDLAKIYSFDPVPKNFDQHYDNNLLGSEGNMWTEHVPNEQVLDSKVFPRIIALAEVLWSYPENRDFEGFYSRLQQHYPTLNEMGINYGAETIGAAIIQKTEGNNSFIELVPNLPDLTIKYAWNNQLEVIIRGNFYDELDSLNNLNLQFQDYTTPFPITESGELTVQAFKNNMPYGEPIKQRFVKNIGMNAKVTYTNPPNKWYKGRGENHLVDGQLGSVNFRDGNWQGFWGQDFEVFIDLGIPSNVNYVKPSFYQYANSWIFLPKRIEISYSNDGVTWEKSKLEPPAKIELSNVKHTLVYTMSAPDNDSGWQYIKVKAFNIGKVPDGHEAAGQDAWLFIDEIIIE